MDLDVVDEIDLAQEREAIATQNAIRQASKEIQPGIEGECRLCGEDSKRLIRMTCARCRDKWKLP